MRNSYRMTETEALRLFQLGGGVDALKSGELNYGQFCNALLSGGQNLRAGRAPLPPSSSADTHALAKSVSKRFVFVYSIFLLAIYM